MIRQKWKRLGWIGWMIFPAWMYFFPINVFPQESATNTASATNISAIPSPEPKFDPQQLLEDITAKRKQLTDEIKSAQKQVEIASATDAVDISKNVEMLQAIDSVYAQQGEALERNSSLHTQNQQYLDEKDKLTSSPPTEPVSFIELDRIREELDVESNRAETFDTRIQVAQSSLDQAQKNYQGKKKALEEFLASNGTVSNATEPAIPQIAANLQVRQASAVVQLRRFELRDEKTAKDVYKTHVDLLKQQIDTLKNHTEFSHDDLEEQIQRISKDEYDVNRDLSRANDLQLSAKSRLTRARDQLAQVSSDNQKMADAEVEARRLETEVLRVKIENLTKFLEMLADRKVAWQRRYSLFNFEMDKGELEKWKNEAKEKLDTLDQEERLLALLASDWQNSLITLKNKIENSANEAAPLLKWYDTQQNNLQQIIDNLQTYQNRIENSRRLFSKLIAEINQHTSLITLTERVQIILNLEFYGNRVSLWFYAGFGAIGLLLILLMVRWFLVSRLRKYAENENNSIVHGFVVSVRRTRPFFLLILSIYVAAHLLTLPTKTSDVIFNINVIALIIQSGIWVSVFVRSLILYYLARKMKRDEASLSALSIFNFLSQLVVWSLATLLVLQNLKIDVTALVTGLGIGGVAVALALQNILGDLFSSLSIVMDKPFVVGDFIIFDNFTYRGTVEHIGIKTTRIRSLTGEQIICSNGDLLKTRIRNFKRMRERRVVFQLGVIYQTPVEKLQKIPVILQNIIESHDKTRFDRAHFNKYGDFSLNFEIVFYVLDPDYNIYMNIQQNINLEIYKRFQQEGIEFAYPTQTLFVAKESATNN